MREEPPVTTIKAESPKQIRFDEVVEEIVERGLIITATETVSKQPTESKPVMVYVVLTTGVANTLLPVEVDNPIVGDQEYDTAPEAEITTELP